MPKAPKIVKSIVLLNQTVLNGGGALPTPFYTPVDSGLFRVSGHAEGTGIGGVIISFTDDTNAQVNAGLGTQAGSSQVCRQKAGVPITYLEGGDGSGNPVNFNLYIVLEQLELD